MILLVDNYDSFTFNLYQYLGEEGQKVCTLRNDQFKLADISKKNFKAIVISPGPGRPENAGLIIPLIKKFSGELPILGVCLGHQAIAQAWGGKIVHAPQILHGKSSRIKHNASLLFEGINNPTLAGRYHSLVADQKTFPAELKITANSLDDKTIMALQHKQHLTFGIQFHPESVLTPDGKKIIRNFLQIALNK